MLMQEQIGVTKDDLEAHVQKNSHVQKMQELKENGTAAENQKKDNPDVVANTVMKIASIKWFFLLNFDS